MVPWMVRPGNIAQIEAIIRSVKPFRFKLVAGFDRWETIGRYLGLGVARVVLGTAALRDQLPGCIKPVRNIPDQIVLGVDAKGGKGCRSGCGRQFLDTTAQRGVLRALVGVPLSCRHLYRYCPGWDA